MPSYEIALFDLDGTLTDPKEGITKSIQYALKRMGVIVNDLDELTQFIGPRLKTLSRISTDSTTTRPTEQ